MVNKLSMKKIKIIKFKYNDIEIDFSLQPKYEDEYKEKIGDGKSYKGVFKTGNKDIPYYMSTIGLIGKNDAGKTKILKKMQIFIRAVCFSNGYQLVNDNVEYTNYSIAFMIESELFYYGCTFNHKGVIKEFLYKDSVEIFNTAVYSKYLKIGDYEIFQYLKNNFFNKFIFNKSFLNGNTLGNEGESKIFLKKMKHRLDLKDSYTKLDSLLISFYKAFYEGFILVIDDIDKGLHSYVLNTLLKMFYDDKTWNEHGTQLLFTAQDITILKYLNLKNIIIVDVSNNNTVTYLIDYTDVNNDMDRWELIKNYFDGYYGGVPDIKTIDR